MTNISTVVKPVQLKELESEDSLLLKKLIKTSSYNKKTSKLPQKQVNQESFSTGTGAQLGTLLAFSNINTPLVQLPKDEVIHEATSTIPLNHHMIGRTVVLLFEHIGAKRPIIIGLLPAGTEVPSSAAKKDIKKKVPFSDQKQEDNLKVTADGETCIVTAEREIQLRCGDASITLTRAGKVLIKGQYILSRSKGANKIKGAYIDIN